MLCMSVFGHTGNTRKNLFPWVPQRNIHLTVQEICALPRDSTGHYFLLPPEMSQCQWNDEAMSINKMWLRSAFGYVYIITNLFFANYYISAHSLLISRHSSFTADKTWLDPASLQALWRCQQHLFQQQWKGEVAMLDFAQLSCCELELIP